MEKLGPRDGETFLAFRIRLAGIKEGRQLILASARRCAGNITDVCRELGVGRHNIPSYLRTCGLQTKDILDCRPENLK
jgi:hypothetical protein